MSESNASLIDWNSAADSICAAMNDRASQLAKRASEDLYESFMHAVQDYLLDNAQFNLSSEIQWRDGLIARLKSERAALAADIQDFLAAEDAFEGVPEDDERINAARQKLRAAIAKAECRS